MRRTLHLITRFGRDERGVFAVIFGVLAIVLVAMAGAVVDFVSLQQSRTTTQVALDAAALALQPEIFEDHDPQDIRQRAQALVRERLGASGRQDIIATVDGIDIDVDDGSLRLEAHVTAPTIFVALVGVNQLDARIVSEATRRKLALEVVMVLDNSGSMTTGNRMTHLKTAAACATNILMMGNCNPTGAETPLEDVMIGIVPFTTLVNVGASLANESWVDRTGAAPKTRDNFDDDHDPATPFNGPIDRIALMNQMNGATWQGCFEAREYPHSTRDTPPDPAQPETLFTPAFNPDEPDSGGYQVSYLPDTPPSCDRPAGTCSFVERRTRCNASRNNSSCTAATIVRSTPSGTQNAFVRVGNQQVWVGPHSPECSCRNPSYGQWEQTGGSGNNRTFERAGTCSNGYVPRYSERIMQERLCKYTNATVTNLSNYLRTPNAGCPTATILPLTENRASVLSSINAMRAEGGTNIHQGTMWGFHVISPGEPFAQGGPYDEATSKVMIVMTDGENTFYTRSNQNNAQFLQAYGYPYNQREGTMSSTNNSMARRMNTLLLETCQNAKAAGITVYTIGLAIDEVTQITEAEARQLLQDCATAADYAYFPRQPSELVDVFEAIAGQLAQLRLAL